MKEAWEKWDGRISQIPFLFYTKCNLGYITFEIWPYETFLGLIHYLVRFAYQNQDSKTYFIFRMVLQVKRSWDLNPMKTAQTQKHSTCMQIFLFGWCVKAKDGTVLSAFSRNASHSKFKGENLKRLSKKAEGLLSFSHHLLSRPKNFSTKELVMNAWEPIDFQRIQLNQFN